MNTGDYACRDDVWRTRSPVENESEGRVCLYPNFQLFIGSDIYN